MAFSADANPGSPAGQPRWGGLTLCVTKPIQQYLESDTKTQAVLKIVRGSQSSRIRTQYQVITKRNYHVADINPKGCMTRRVGLEDCSDIESKFGDLFTRERRGIIG